MENGAGESAEILGGKPDDLIFLQHKLIDLTGM